MVAKRAKTSGGSQSSPPPAPGDSQSKRRQGLHARAIRLTLDYSPCSLPPLPRHLALLSLLVTVTTAATVLPHLGNMKHSPKIHIKRPTNKSNLKVRAVAARARDELFWEAAEDKCCCVLEMLATLQNTGRKVGRTGQQEDALSRRLLAGLLVNCLVFGGAGRSCITSFPAGLCSSAN